MDPISLAIALGVVFGQLIGRAADITLAKSLETLLLHGAEQVKRNQAQSQALDAALAAASQAGDAGVGTRLGRALNRLKDNRGLAARVAAAVVEITSADPRRIPADLLRDLDLTETERSAFSRFLTVLREKLVAAPGYGDGIRYADELDKRGLLVGTYQLVRSVVGQTDGQSFLWVRELPLDTRALERPYLNFVQAEFEAPGMESRSWDKSVGKSVRLERIYIALNTSEVRLVRVSENEQQRRGRSGPVGVELKPVPLSALRAVMQTQRAALLGDPGAGKSTFAQHLCLCLAAARASATEAEAAQWLAELKSYDVDQWALPAYFPIYIRLRTFAADFDALPDDDELGQDKHLLAFLEKQFRARGFGDLYQHAVQLLNDGQALVVFDGLDEVRHPQRHTPEADAARRLKVAQAIRHFGLTRFREARSLVTCRIRQYRAANGAPTEWATELERLPVFTLSDFDWPQAQQFVEHWFTELHARGRGGERDPRAAVAALLRVFEVNPRLRELAAKPIVLTQMALVHAVHQLPDSRVEVYVECAKLLLWDWEILKARLSQRRETAEEFLNALAPGLALDTIRKALDEAVFHAHAAGETEVSGERLRAALARSLAAHVGAPSPQQLLSAQAFINGWLRDRNGLLVPATGDDAFDAPHPSLREFMAGRFLHENRLPNPKNNERESWDVSGPRLVKGDLDKWREVLRFAAGLEESREEVADALYRLCPDAPSLEPAHVDHLLLAAELTLDVGPDKLRYEDNTVGQRVFERMQSQLVHLMRDTSDQGVYPDDQPRYTAPGLLSPKIRLTAGELLSDLGWVPPDLDDLVPVTPPAGAAFWIGKYPVTNLQYSRFLAASDYADETLWRSLVIYDQAGQARHNIGDVAWDWLQGAGGVDRKPEYWTEVRFGANRRLFPVVGVTWYEAAAYSAWWGRHRREYANDPAIPADLEFRLPLEVEWVAAAGGEQDNRYPWQAGKQAMTDDTIPAYANTAESKFNGTTPVGMYPAGMSPARVMDMAGNVWEWQANWYDKGYHSIALRGGAWNRYTPPSVQRRRRGSSRSYIPHNEWDGNGFRVVGVVPVFP